MDNSDLPKDVLAPAEGPRENLVNTAVKFLQNPKVHQSPLYQKEAFLERKGLTKEEIKLAVERAGVSQDASPPTPPTDVNMALRPVQQSMPPVSTWTRARDLATTAVLVSSVIYAVYSAFTKWIQPWLSSKKEEEERVSKIESSIISLQASVTHSNAQIVQTLKAIQDIISSQQGIIRQPDLSLGSNSSQVLSDIKTELASVKGLLLNRRQFPPPPATTPILPAWQRSATQSSELNESNLTQTTGQQLVVQQLNRSAQQVEESSESLVTASSETLFQAVSDSSVRADDPHTAESDAAHFSSSSEDSVISDLSVTQSVNVNSGFELVQAAPDSAPEEVVG